MDKKIFFLTHEFYPRRGGIATYVEELARAAADDYDIEVWAPTHPDITQPRFPFSIYPLELKGSQNLTCLYKLWKAIKSRKDLKGMSIYLPEPGPLLLFMYLNAVSAIPSNNLVITLHGTELLKFCRIPHYRFLFRRLLKKCMRIGVVSEYNRDLLFENFPETSERAVLVPGGLKHDFVNIERIERNDDRIRLLTVGRIHPRKGQLAVVEALGILPDHERSRIDYHIVGPIVDESYLEEIRQLGKEFKVNLFFKYGVGDEELRSEYASADIFVMSSMPYRYSVEGFGLVYLEAGACGLPVVAHNIGGVSDAVRDGMTGFLVDPDNREALAESISKLSNDPMLRKTFGTNGSRRAQEISWKKNVELLFDGIV